MLREFLLPELRIRRIELTTVWFQQDGLLAIHVLFKNIKICYSSKNKCVLVF
jgi:hypothetical protein